MSTPDRTFARLLVTGACGFIGSNFARAWLVAHPGSVLNIDALTYAGDPRRVSDLDTARYRHVKIDVADAEAVRQIVGDFRPDAVVHFAAETHVTRSEDAEEEFRRANVDGTRALLDALVEQPPTIAIHISTDEVYGPALGEPFAEDQKEPGEGLATSPYARSKAVADDVARGYFGRLPLIVARPTNAFGPWQHPEKALPRWTVRALRGQQLPVWGDGGYVRDWLDVGDLAAALVLLLQRGTTDEVYNIGPSRDPEITNATLAAWILRHLEQAEDRIVFTEYDRPQHDRRYAVDASKIRALGWSPTGDVWARFADTIEWYRANPWWWEPLLEQAEEIYADREELEDAKR